MRAPRHLTPLDRAGWALVVGGVTYSSWILGAVLRTGLSVRASYASDYEATGHPYAWVFRGLDVISGTLLFVGAAVVAMDVVAGRVRIGPVAARRWFTAATVAIGVTGLATAVAGPLPLDCTTFNGDCTRLRASGFTPTWHNVAHLVVSDVAGWAFGVALAATLVAVLVGARLRYLSHGAGWLVLAALVTSVPAGNLLWTVGWRGVPQRANELVESVFFVLVGMSVVGLPRDGQPGRVRESLTRTRPGF